MFEHVIRSVFAALLVAAVVPAGVCEAACQQPAPPPCHGEAQDAGHDADECSGCDQPATLSQSEGVSQIAVAHATVAPALLAPPRPAARRLTAPRGPPGPFLEPYALTHRPLLS